MLSVRRRAEKIFRRKLDPNWTFHEAVRPLQNVPPQFMTAQTSKSFSIALDNDDRSQ
jgi:hypothetical protein